MKKQISLDHGYLVKEQRLSFKNYTLINNSLLEDYFYNNNDMESKFNYKLLRLEEAFLVYFDLKQSYGSKLGHIVCIQGEECQSKDMKLRIAAIQTGFNERKIFFINLI